MPTRKLLSAEESLRRLEAALGIGYWTLIIQPETLHWSPGLYALLGLKPEVVRPDMALYNGMVHPDDQREWDDTLHMARDADRSNSTIRIIRPSGELVSVRTQFIKQYARDGSLIALHGVMTDVTDYENEIRSARGRWVFAQSIKKLVQGTLWRAGADGRLIETADWVRLTGQSAAEARDWDKLDAIHPDDRFMFRKSWSDAIRDLRPLRHLVRIRHTDGHYMTHETRATPVLNDDGALIEWHGITFPALGILESKVEAINSGQIRAARALLDWTGPQLADQSGISFSTIKRMEKSERSVKPETVQKVKETLEAAGVRFGLDHRGGVWLTISGNM